MVLKYKKENGWMCSLLYIFGVCLPHKVVKSCQVTTRALNNVLHRKIMSRNYKGPSKISTP